MLTVLTAATETKLVELSEVKTRLGITSSGDDALLDLLIADASSAIERYLGRSLGRQRYSETIGSDGAVEMMLSRHPVEPGTWTIVDDDSETVSDVVLHDAEAGILFRDAGWWSRERGFAAGFRSTQPGVGRFGEDVSLPGAEAPDYTAEYWAGYLLPGEVADWEAETTYAAGDFVRSTSRKPVLFEATTAGDSDATEPDWDTEIGETTPDGTVIWTARAAQELPGLFKRAAFLAVAGWYRSDDRDPSIVSEGIAGGPQLRYSDAAAARARGLPTEVLELLMGEAA